MNLNPNSLKVRKNCVVEPSFDGAGAYDSFQFVRNGYFWLMQGSRPKLWYLTQDCVFKEFF